MIRQTTDGRYECFANTGTVPFICPLLGTQLHGKERR